MSRERRHSRRPRDRGVALLVVVTWLALMIALVGEFTYGTTVEAAQAANARDELKAHYMARSAVNLSRLLIKIQQRFVEPVMGQAQKMLQQAMGGAGGASGSSSTAGLPPSLGISLRITDYAGMLMGFFSGSKDEVAGLGSLIGLDVSQAKGLGMKSGRFDAEILAEDGKIDLNCGGGVTTVDVARQFQVYRLLTGLLYSQRYDRMFSERDGSGQYSSRRDVARALIDWADFDPNLFAPGSSAEDYRYDATEDKYVAHDNFYDSVEEIRLVRGVTDAFVEAFGPYLTTYSNKDGRCRVNLGAISNRAADCTPLVMGVIRAAGIPDPNLMVPTDPAILDDVKLYPIASVLCDRASAGGFDSLDTIMKVLAKPEVAVANDDPRYRTLQGMRPLMLDRANLDGMAYVGPAHVYRIVATGEAGKVKKKITAVIETGRYLDNPLTQNFESERAAGVIQYWREE